MGTNKIGVVTQGCNENSSKSQRARSGKLDTEKKTCKYCGHKKAFTGNPMGQNITKCCKCKRRAN